MRFVTKENGGYGNRIIDYDDRPQKFLHQFVTEKFFFNVILCYDNLSHV
jgi:hypothetical protein